MQRAPQNFGEKYWLLPIWAEGGHQGGEGGSQSWRSFLAGELNFRRQDEHCLIDNRSRKAKIDIGATGVAQNIRSCGGVRRTHFQQRRKLLESFSGDRSHDFGLALKMAVENRLAIVDERRETARCDSIPALGFGQFTRPGQNELVVFRALALFAFQDRHSQNLTSNENMSTLDFY